MKKLKLLPTILMLVLCVGVLAIGIYAVTPTKNTISGSITINASNPEVFISAYRYNADGTMAETPYFTETSSRSGITIPLPTTNMTIESDDVNTQAQLDALSIKIGIKVRSTNSQSLGVYFCDKEMSAEATSSSDVATQYVLLKDAEDSSIFSAYLSGYTELTNTTPVVMDINFKLDQFPTQTQTFNFGEQTEQLKLYLNVENYNGNLVPASVIGTGKTTITAEDYASATNKKKIIIAEGVQSIEANAFKGASTLQEIQFPSTLKTIGQEAFYECSSLLYVLLPNSITTIYEYAFAFCSSLKSVWFPGKTFLLDTGIFFASVGFEVVGNSQDYYFSSCSLTIFAADGFVEDKKIEGADEQYVPEWDYIDDAEGYRFKTGAGEEFYKQNASIESFIEFTEQYMTLSHEGII